MVHVQLLAMKEFFSFFSNHIFYVITGLFPIINTAAPLQLYEVLHSDLFCGLHL